jgi:enoyl-CoA hydratase
MSVDVRLHRMLRLGTSYGLMLPEGVFEDDGADRGIIFVFAGAHPERQFEFVKTQWLNDGIFIGAPAEKDPLAGANDGTGTFTIPQRPIRRRLQSMPPFVITRGGEYCFAPGLRALRWLAELDTQNGRTGRKENVATSPARTDRWKALDFGPPSSDSDEPDLPVLVEYTQDERVAVITLNRPHADNAITTAMGARLTEILETIAVRPAVRAVILTGAGRRAFSVGSDLRQRKNMTKEDWLRQRQDFDRTLYTVRQLRKPIFTAVNGIAYGGGCELAQSTDFIIASDNATFGQPEAMLGLAAGGGSPALLPRVLPPGKAMQMLMTGDPISAQEAHRLGMVNELYAQDELIDAARRIAGKIASNSPTAVQAVKQAVRMGQGEPIEQAIAIMMEAHWRSAVHPDRAEGIGAFNEDREPTFADPDH